MAAPSAGSWSYADNWRILTGFLGASIGLLAIGIAAVATARAEAAYGAGILLSVATFLVVFAVVLFFPRLARRGVKNYWLLVDRPIGEVEQEVRRALEATGRPVLVEVLRSRSDHPTRIVTAEGVSWRFRLEPVSRREIGSNAGERTEVIQVGVLGAGDPEAKAWRELVAARIRSHDDGDA